MTQTHWSKDPRELTRYLNRLEEQHSQRLALDRLILRQYYGRGGTTQVAQAVQASSSQNILKAVESVRQGGFSLIRAAIDTAVSLVARMPAVKCQPTGETFSVRRRTKLQTRFLNGVMYAVDLKKRAHQAFIDGCTARVGALLFYVDNEDTIRCERVNPLDLFWDETEDSVSPRNLARVHAVPRMQLAARFPDHAQAISSLPRYSPTSNPGVNLWSQDDGDRVKVVEGWCLPLGKDKGAHVVQSGDLTLAREDYPFERHCVATYRWGTSFDSFGGKPLGEILIPYQLWTNRIVRMIDEGLKNCIPRLMVHENAEVEGYTTTSMEKILWAGQIPPTVQMGEGLSSDLVAWRDTLQREAFNEAGVNIAAVAGVKPAGLTSAVALREYQDIANSRLIAPTAAFDAFITDCAKIILMLAETTYVKEPARVRAPGTKQLDEIEWKAGQLKESEYSVEVQATSALPLTVSGRLDFVKELLAEGLISRETGTRLLQLPDVEAELDRLNAPRDLAEKQVEMALWEGKYAPMNPYQDPNLVLEIGTAEYMKADLNGTFPPENMEILRRLIANAQSMVKAPAPASVAIPPPPSDVPQSDGQLTTTAVS